MAAKTSFLLLALFGLLAATLAKSVPGALIKDTMKDTTVVSVGGELMTEEQEMDGGCQVVVSNIVTPQGVTNIISDYSSGVEILKPEHVDEMCFVRQMSDQEKEEGSPACKAPQTGEDEEDGVDAVQSQLRVEAEPDESLRARLNYRQQMECEGKDLYEANYVEEGEEEEEEGEEEEGVEAESGSVEGAGRAKRAIRCLYRRTTYRIRVCYYNGRLCFYRYVTVIRRIRCWNTSG